MIGWFVPHSIYPAGYHCDPKQPLPFASIASQKNHLAIYLFCTYLDATDADRFRAAWLATGKKLDMGKSCVRFRRIEDVPLDVVADAVRRMPVKAFIEQYERAVPAARASRSASARAVKSTAVNTTAVKTKALKKKAVPAAKSNAAATRTAKTSKATKSTAAATRTAKSSKAAKTKATSTARSRSSPRRSDR